MWNNEFVVVLFKCIKELRKGIENQKSIAYWKVRIYFFGSHFLKKVISLENDTNSSVTFQFVITIKLMDTHCCLAIWNVPSSK